MQHRFKTESGEYLAVDVPKEAKNIQLDNWMKWLSYNQDEFVQLPPFDWEIICTYPGITGEQVKSVIEFANEFEHSYRNYKGGSEFSIYQYFESFSSLMEKEGLSTCEKLVILKLK